MIITVVGLGLIGGSVCKTLKKNTDNLVFGIDNNEKTLMLSLNEKSIDKIANPSDLGETDITVICLYPEDVLSFVQTNKKCFKKGSVVIDMCGVKELIVEKSTKILQELGVNFVGTHPMAGRQFSGYVYSMDNLFENSNYIITPINSTCEKSVDIVENFAKSLGATKIIRTSPANHDKMIAFTSQLAHVVSNAYVKSPEMENVRGYTAGSYRDLTRVAKLNPNMWTSLFMQNKQNLIDEIDCIIENLEEYKKALKNDDKENLHKLLKEGSDIKEKSL